MKTDLQNIRNIGHFLAYTKTKSKRNGRVRSLKYFQSWWMKCNKSHPSSSMIILLQFFKDDLNMTVSDKTTPTTYTHHRMSDDDETWSGEDQIYDYLTIPGLNTKFGLNGKDYDCFIIQQKVDNALDFIEQNSKKFVNGQIPFLSVIITEIEDKVEDGGGKVIQVSVRNSNAVIRRGRNFTFFLPRLQKSKIDPPLNLKII